MELDGAISWHSCTFKELLSQELHRLPQQVYRLHVSTDVVLTDIVATTMHMAGQGN